MDYLDKWVGLAMYATDIQQIYECGRGGAIIEISPIEL